MNPSIRVTHHIPTFSHLSSRPLPDNHLEGTKLNQPRLSPGTHNDDIPSCRTSDQLTNYCIRTELK